MSLSLKLLSTGKALPSKKMTSAELDTLLNKKAGFTEKKSGIVYRHYLNLDKGETTTQLAADALKDAMRAGNIDPDSIDLLICGSAIPQQALPCTASFVLPLAGLPDSTPGFDVNASCLGFLNAMHVAANLLATGAYKRIAIVASEAASLGVNYDDPESSLIFGDGAAAAIFEKGDGSSRCEAYKLQTFPKGKEYCQIRIGGTLRNLRAGFDESDFKFQMQGKRVFRLTAEKINPLLDNMFAALPYDRGDMDVVIPHQASHLGMLHISERLALREDAIINIYPTHGNQIAASIPTALHEARITGRLTPGTKVLFIGTAAGLTIGAMVLTI